MTELEQKETFREMNRITNRLNRRLDLALITTVLMSSLFIFSATYVSIVYIYNTFGLSFQQ